MRHGRYERGHGEFDGCHRGAGSLIGLIFAIVSFSITLAFKVVEVVFQALFGVLSGLKSSSPNVHRTNRNTERPMQDKETASYTVSNDKQEATEKKPEEKPINETKNNVRDFKKPENNQEKAEAKGSENNKKSEEVHNKDIYVVLFILTIIPAIVTLSMGKLLYAGIIGAVGFGLMLITGILMRIAEGFKQKAEMQEEEEVEVGPEKNETVEKLIKEAFDKLFEIRKDIDDIKDPLAREKIEAVCCTGEKIIGEVRTNPEGLTHVRKFFYYYLDAFGEIVKKYLKLSSFEASSEEVGKLIAETEKSFADIDSIFKELCEKLLEKDMMHLKAEINVIKNSN